MSDAIEARLRRVNDELLIVGNDYSDVLLDAVSEIEALHAKLADGQAVIRDRGHEADCPASSSACAICGLHELLHSCVTYFGDGQNHQFTRGPCSDACGHDRTTGEKA